jgi:hypothetical protein
MLEVGEQRFDTAFVCLWQQDSDGTWRIHADIFKPWTS